LLQPELYKKEMLARQTSSDSSGTGEMEYCGKLHFALRYDSEMEGLVVKVNKHCKRKEMKYNVKRNALSLRVERVSSLRY
jgi:hypothetical protein